METLTTQDTENFNTIDSDAEMQRQGFMSRKFGEHAINAVTLDELIDDVLSTQD